MDDLVMTLGQPWANVAWIVFAGTDPVFGVGSRGACSLSRPPRPPRANRKYNDAIIHVRQGASIALDDPVPERRFSRTGPSRETLEASIDGSVKCLWNVHLQESIRQTDT